MLDVIIIIIIFSSNASNLIYIATSNNFEQQLLWIVEYALIRVQHAIHVLFTASFKRYGNATV